MDSIEHNWLELNNNELKESRRIAEASRWRKSVAGNSSMRLDASSREETHRKKGAHVRPHVTADFFGLDWLPVVGSSAEMMQPVEAQILHENWAPEPLKEGKVVKLLTGKVIKDGTTGGDTLLSTVMEHRDHWKCIDF